MKPKYSFFKNFAYARAGLAQIYKSEKSFRLEVAIFGTLTLLLFLFKFDSVYNILIISAQVFVLALECVNSAIERVVDLVTNEYHELAKQAKDAGSAAVMIGNFFVGFAWILAIMTKI